jgi:hypothetical protein
MTLEDFIESLTQSHPPAGINDHLQALWFDGKNDWESAHSLIQDNSNSHSALIHAYLHRKEGDIGNADYWYRGAGRKRPALSLRDEWEEIVKELLK